MSPQQGGPQPLAATTLPCWVTPCEPPQDNQGCAVGQNLLPVRNTPGINESPGKQLSSPEINPVCCFQHPEIVSLGRSEHLCFDVLLQLPQGSSPTVLFRGAALGWPAFYLIYVHTHTHITCFNFTQIHHDFLFSELRMFPLLEQLCWLAGPEWLSFTTEAAKTRMGWMPSLAFECYGFCWALWRRGRWKVTEMGWANVTAAWERPCSERMGLDRVAEWEMEPV